MSGCMDFDYYYGIEAEQFSFYRVPRILIKDERFRGLSSDAKLLYGLMLDRMALSMKNGWLDGQNRAYIYYTLDNIMDDLGCGREKCVKILSELDNRKGIGLIEKKRQGLGRPDIIYVKNFATVQSGTGQTGLDEEFSVSDNYVQDADGSNTDISAQSIDVPDGISIQNGNVSHSVVLEKAKTASGRDIPISSGVISENDFSMECEEFAEREIYTQIIDAREHLDSIKARDTGIEELDGRSREIELAEVGKSNFWKSEKQTSDNMAVELKEAEESDIKRQEADLIINQKMEFVETAKPSPQKSENRTCRSLETELAEVGKPNFWKSENRTCRSLETELLEVGKSNFWKSENRTSGSLETELAEVGKTDSNYTERNNTDIRQNDRNDIENSYMEEKQTDASHIKLSKKESNYNSFCNINPINQSNQSGNLSVNLSCQSAGQSSRQKTGRMDKMEKAEGYMELIKKNIEYDHFMQYGSPGDKELFNNLYDVICSVVCADCEAVRISGASYPHEMVKSRFLKLNRSHMEYVMYCLNKNTGEVHNINEYLKASLFNSLNTIDSYYQQAVRHDMYGGGWAESGVI